MRTAMIAFAGHQFYVRSDAEEPFDLVAVNLFKAELKRLTEIADRGQGTFKLLTDEAGARRWQRDNFATSALTGLLASFGGIDRPKPPSSEMAAEAYELADAMLAERDKTKPDAT